MGIVIKPYLFQHSMGINKKMKNNKRNNGKKIKNIYKKTKCG